jgi:hypothetical protein
MLFFSLQFFFSKSIYDIHNFIVILHKCITINILLKSNRNWKALCDRKLTKYYNRWCFYCISSLKILFILIVLCFIFIFNFIIQFFLFIMNWVSWFVLILFFCYPNLVTWITSWRVNMVDSSFFFNWVFFLISSFNIFLIGDYRLHDLF